MNYRKAIINDANQLDELLNKLIEDERQYDKNIDPNLRVSNFYQSRIGLTGHVLYVCEEDNKIIGYIYYYPLENNAMKIDALYVEEEYRKQGIASKLIDMVIVDLKNIKATAIEINVLKDNIKARELYLKKGFAVFKETLKLDL